MVDQAALVVSTYPHHEEDIGYDVPKGLAFFARLKPVGLCPFDTRINTHTSLSLFLLSFPTHTR